MPSPDSPSPTTEDLQLVARLDLVKLAKALKAEGRHPELVAAVDRAAAAGSTRDDLRSALAALKLIEGIRDELADGSTEFAANHAQTTMAGALFTEAIILYARATATSGARPKLLGEAKLSRTERSTHDEAMKYRDSVLAHFGRGEMLSDGPIIKEALVLTLFRSASGPKNKIDAFTVRAQHKVAFAARLAQLIETRLGQISERYHPLFADVDRKLGTAVKSDPALGRSLPSFAFDPNAFCGSPTTAARLLAQMEAGSVEDMDYTIPFRKP